MIAIEITGEQRLRTHMMLGTMTTNLDDSILLKKIRKVAGLSTEEVAVLGLHIEIVDPRTGAGYWAFDQVKAAALLGTKIELEDEYARRLYQALKTSPGHTAENNDWAETLAEALK